MYSQNITPTNLFNRELSDPSWRRWFDMIQSAGVNRIGGGGAIGGLQQALPPVGGGIYEPHPGRQVTGGPFAPQNPATMHGMPQTSPLASEKTAPKKKPNSYYSGTAVINGPFGG